MIAYEIAKYLNVKAKPFAKIRIDELDEGEEGLFLSQYPGTMSTTVYLNGDEEGQFDFGIIAKTKTKDKALQCLQKIDETMKNLESIQMDTVEITKITVSNTPWLYDRWQNGSFLYTNEYHVEYTKKKGVL